MARGHDRLEHIFEPRAPVLEEAFFGKDSHQRPDGRVAGRVVHGLENFRGSGAAPCVHDVHDLPFPAAESRQEFRSGRGFGHECCFISILLGVNEKGGVIQHGLPKLEAAHTVRL